MTEQEQYNEAMTKLENIFGKENLEALQTQLVARHGTGEKLEGVLKDALTHLDKNYTPEAAGELFEDGQFLDVDRISEWSDKGSESQLEFPSQNDESGVEPEKDQDYEGLNFDESMSEYD